MTDQPGAIPDQQAHTPGQQVTPNPDPTPPGDGWKPRYDGAILKIQQLTQQLRDAESQLAAKSSEIEQLKAQLSIKDTEKTVAVGERDTRLQQALTRVSELETENTGLKGLKLKVKVANDLKRPELLRIVDHIPNLTDEEVLKTVMQDIAGFGDELVASREKQLMAGITPNLGPGGSVVSAPSTKQAWEEKINGLALGSTERAKTMNDYGDWLERQHQS